MSSSPGKVSHALPARTLVLQYAYKLRASAALARSSCRCSQVIRIASMPPTHGTPRTVLNVTQSRMVTSTARAWSSTRGIFWILCAVSPVPFWIALVYLVILWWRAIRSLHVLVGADARFGEPCGQFASCRHSPKFGDLLVFLTRAAAMLMCLRGSGCQKMRRGMVRDARRSDETVVPGRSCSSSGWNAHHHRLSRYPSMP